MVVTDARQIKFGVEYISKHSDSIVVAGRCCGDTILLEDRFAAVYDPDTPPSSSTFVEGIKVCLTVVSIEPFGDVFMTDWDSVDPGFSARIELTGHGAEKVRPFCVLANDDQYP